MFLLVKFWPASRQKKLPPQHSMTVGVAAACRLHKVEKAWSLQLLKGQQRNLSNENNCLPTHTVCTKWPSVHYRSHSCDALCFCLCFLVDPYKILSIKFQLIWKRDYEVETWILQLTDHIEPVSTVHARLSFCLACTALALSLVLGW